MMYLIYFSDLGRKLEEMPKPNGAIVLRNLTEFGSGARIGSREPDHLRIGSQRSPKRPNPYPGLRSALYYCVVVYGVRVTTFLIPRNIKTYGT